MSSWDREDLQKGSSWRIGVGKAMAGRVTVPHLHADKLGGKTGE